MSIGRPYPDRVAIDEWHPPRPDGPPLSPDDAVRLSGDPCAALWPQMGLTAYRAGDYLQVWSGDAMTGLQRLDQDGTPIGPWHAIVHTIDCCPPTTTPGER